MVMPQHHRPWQAQAGWLMTDYFVAIAILLLAVLPLVGLYVHEHRLARSYYDRALLVEVVDGEMEALVAGGWKTLPKGASDYALPLDIRTNLPPGHLQLTITVDQVTLNWIPESAHRGGAVTRAWRIQ